MYAAILSDGELINAECAIKQVTGPYFCPRCGQVVQLLQNKQGQAFFRHRSQQLGGAERPLHLAGKQGLAESLANMEIEAKTEWRLGAASERRADLAFSLNHQLFALEFQCAPLALKELQDRHRSYQTLAVTEYWLLGTTYLQPKTLKSALKFCAYQPQWGYYLVFWLVDQQRLVLFSHLHFRPPATRVYYERHVISLAAFLRGVQRCGPPPRVISPLALSFDPRPWLARQLRSQQPRWMSLQSRCYQQGWRLQDLPDNLFLPARLPPVVSHWPLLLARQIDWYLNHGPLTWSQRWPLLSQSNWPLLQK